MELSLQLQLIADCVCCVKMILNEEKMYMYFKEFLIKQLFKQPSNNHVLTRKSKFCCSIGTMHMLYIDILFKHTLTSKPTNELMFFR